MQLDDLYRDVIVDHYNHPRNYGKPEKSDIVVEGKNPVCGDEITIYLNVKDGVIADVHFEGKGCSISIASASVMTESLIGKNLEEAKIVLDDFNNMLRGEACERCENYSDAVAFQGVTKFPVRVKCALLAWKTVEGAINGNSHK
ncbi:MAG: SUF system NifU family Fe-S cluster assembly protein [candidate division Zixibacteria bacterium]|nr:SUF system NifU family Fe-S cluster assembly protein [candidate division Zixibacteria bacterium]